MEKTFISLFFSSGTINSSSHDEPILIQGLEHQNRSVDGDTVVFEMLNERDWSAPAEIVLEDEQSSFNDQGDSLDKEKKVRLVFETFTSNFFFFNPADPRGIT